MRKYSLAAVVTILVSALGVLIWLALPVSHETIDEPKSLFSAWTGPLFTGPPSSTCPFIANDTAQILFNQDGMLIIDTGGDIVCTFSYRTFIHDTQQTLEIRENANVVFYTYTIEGARLILESGNHTRYEYTWRERYRDPGLW